MFCGVIQKIVDLCMVNYRFDDDGGGGDDSHLKETNEDCLRPKQQRDRSTQTDSDYSREISTTKSNNRKNIDNQIVPLQAYVFLVMDTVPPTLLPLSAQKPRSYQMISSFLEPKPNVAVPLSRKPAENAEFVLELPVLESADFISKLRFPSTRPNVADEYQKSFYQKDHCNLVCMDEILGPVVLSLKNEDDGFKKYTMKCILRLSTGSKFTAIDYSSIAHKEAPFIYKRIVMQLDQRLYRNNLQLVSIQNCLDASRQILEFDKKMEVNAFKFGILYQKSGQVSEESILSNRGHSETFERFLDTIAERVQLKNFDKYLGGLDKCGDVETESYYTTFRGKEIMFHVSTMIPYRSGDRQQLERKRHIGNDIVVIVFQDCVDTSFDPEMFQSRFSHCMIIVRPVHTSDGTAYEMNVLRRKDVPEFPPPIPPHCIPGGAYLKTFLLTKLIEAEYACYRANQFRGLQATARKCLLESLVVKLRPDLFRNSSESSSMSEGALPTIRSSRNSVMYTVKKALLSKRLKQKLAEQSLAARAKSLPSESEATRLPELNGQQDENDLAEFRRTRNMSDSNQNPKILFRPYSSFMGWLSQDSLDKVEEPDQTTSQDPPSLAIEGLEEEDEAGSADESQTATLSEDQQPESDDSATIRKFQSLTSIQSIQLPKKKNNSLTALPTITSSGQV